MRRVVTIYAVVSAIFVVGMCLVLYVGQNYFPAPSAAALPGGLHSSTWSVLLENFNDPLTRLLMQFIVILVATRLVGMLVSLIGQPAVVGEILAGILLGPSLLGWIAPGFF